MWADISDDGSVLHIIIAIVTDIFNIIIAIVTDISPVCSPASVRQERKPKPSKLLDDPFLSNQVTFFDNDTNRTKTNTVRSSLATIFAVLNPDSRRCFTNASAYPPIARIGFYQLAITPGDLYCAAAVIVTNNKTSVYLLFAVLTPDGRYWIPNASTPTNARIGIHHIAITPGDRYVAATFAFATSFFAIPQSDQLSE